MIRTLIIDDEMKSQATLHKLLEKYCNGLEIVGFANNVKSGVKAINDLKPDLVFLDISMPDGDGFEVLQQVKNREFEVVFTTAFNDYAIKAFQFSALHYLLKPINYIELQHAVERYKESHQDLDLNEKIQVLFDSLNNQHKKIVLPTSNGLKVVEVENIIYCRADGSYTHFYIVDEDPIMVSKALSNFEELLPSELFCRVHNKHLINLNFVDNYVKGRGGKVILENKKEIEVSEGRKAEFLSRLKKIADFLPDSKK
ncbi:LytR/AlgR family response regulator transcription factor [Marinifilum caeruleilacunae]|uniref:Response regulator transcription factor n=1 Tax=Marinifilum caeruleilacunae TaxID=2499076 RepID=A0ABX1WU71_9BACT|nr:LytTR family DNA-binding domain-containing protein [Marinifilum caeruleilacunae]NOU59468.1 response regulator transcription factor [Marinifilum caeruleilacunae]